MFSNGFPKEWSTLRKLAWLYRTVINAVSAVLKTVTGNPIHILDALAKPAQALSVKLEPIQDLHGYDNPWPAGGGKNKFDVDAIVQSGYITVSNGVISVTGQSVSAGKTLGQLANLTVGESYLLSATTTGNANYIYLLSSGNSWYFGTQRTITETDLNSNVRFYSGAADTTAQISNMMIRLSSVADSTFAPYSNICPISGHTDADVVRTGKNMLDPSKRTSYGSGMGQRWYYADGFTLKANQAYTFSVTYANPIALYIIDKATVTNLATGNNSITYTPTEDTIVYFQAYRGQDISAVDTFQLELGSTHSAYSPYVGTTYPIPLGQTVYGGTLDVVTGVLTVTKVSLLFDNSAWSFLNTFFYKTVLSAGDCVSDYYTTENGVTIYLNGNNGQARIYLADNSFLTSESDVGSLLNGYKLVYALPTPQTIQLTPTQVELLQGENNIWSDGEMTLVYLADGNASDEEALNILLGGRYVNNHTEDEPTDREALDILLGR